MAADTTRETDSWEEIIQNSDEEAFRELVEPYLDVLLAAARRDIQFYRRNGLLHEEDFTPEELVGEGLIHSWEHRDVRPPDMALRSWLLGTQHRVSHGLVRNLHRYRQKKDLSLDEPIPVNVVAQDTQEWFWDWYQPERELTWEDVIPSRTPADVEVGLNEEREALLDDTEKRHALILHDEFEMSLPDVSFTINRSPDAVAKLLEQARAGLRERLGDREQEEPRKPPNP